MLKSVFKFHLFCSVIAAGGPLWAQTYNLGIRQQLALWEQYYGVSGRDAAARQGRDSFYSTEADNGCVGCDENPLFRRVDVSGIDERLLGPNRVNPKVMLTEEETKTYNGIQMFVCGSTNGAGTVTMIKDENGERKFVSSMHVVMPKPVQFEVAELEKMFDGQELEDRLNAIFREQFSTCEIYVFEDMKDNLPRRYKVNVERVAFDSLKPSFERGKDWIAFKIQNEDATIRKLNPIKLVVDNRESINATMVAFHHDVPPAGLKIKTKGEVRIPSSDSEFRLIPNITVHEIDTNGWVSGATLLNENSEAFAIHVGGKIPAGGSTDWKTVGNIAARVTNSMITKINRL